MSAEIANTRTSPAWNGSEMSAGKKSLPVRFATFDAGSEDSTPVGPRRAAIGLIPRNAANRIPTGGRPARLSATPDGTPCAISPPDSVSGSVFARPTTMSEKNTPIDSADPELKKVIRMPDATPRCAGGTAFMTTEALGELNIPLPTPLRNVRKAKAG